MYLPYQQVKLLHEERVQEMQHAATPLRNPLQTKRFRQVWASLRNLPHSDDKPIG
jgi:hypothetical protein